ncbi:hypothetical protein DFH06DRAFT_1463908 [Mycena polygramma]|nr:hypothetical protein DFH06DRAFT_1463908 [Mycena polygramma]
MRLRLAGEPYEWFVKRIRVKLQNSGPESLVKLLDNIALAGQDISLDFEGLHPRVHVWSSWPPSLNDLYGAHVEFFEAVLATSRACNKYLACCCVAFDPTIKTRELPQAAEPESSFRSFKDQYEELRKSITRLQLCWTETEGVVMEELQGHLQVPPGLEWTLRVEWFFGLGRAHLVTLRDDLPTLATKARLHCDIFGAHYESLEAMVKRVEAVRAGAPNAVMSRDAAVNVTIEGEWIRSFLFVFTDFKPRLENAGPESLVKLVDQIARAGQDISRDFEGLYSRMYLWTYQAPSLNDLYFAHVEFFEAVLATSRACNKYLACYCIALNPAIVIPGLPQDAEPEPSFRTFKEQYEKLRTSITNLKLCWEKTEGVVMEELQGHMQGNQWTLRVEWALGFGRAQFVELSDDLPTLVTKAKLHCNIFGAHYQSLEAMVKRVEAVRAGAPHAVMSRDTASNVTMEGEWICCLLYVFTDLKLGLGLLTLRGHRYPDTFQEY